MATSVLLGTRPDWTRSTLGIPIDTIARIHPGAAGAKPDLAYSRNRVSVSRVPGAAAKPEDEYDVGYVYGPEASNQDLASRSLMPLLRKFVDGYNVTVLAFGATGSGKTLLLEGSRGKERHSSEGNGLVHIAVDELFKLLNEKAVSVGNAVAERRRLPSARAFDFFLESSFVELYREEVHDMFGRPGATKASLQIYEDPTEGYQVSGLAYRIAKTSTEMRTAFNFGRMARDATKEDVGNVHERSAAIFTIHLAQYSPAAVAGEEDRIMVSKIQFVDLPGAERLAEDPEILRLREGPVLNRALHALGATLRCLAEGPGGGLAAAAASAAASAAAAAGGGGSMYGSVGLGSVLAAAGNNVGGINGGPLGAAVGSGVPFINYEESVLTKLLSDALGGNSLCLVAGTMRQADGTNGLHAINTLQYLTIARSARNFPIINHGRARGLIQKLRQRLMAVVDDRQALRELMDGTPAEGDSNAMAINIAKLRDMEARLMAVRSENAELVEEKQAMQARLQKLYQAEEGDLQEKGELQEALIQSEEQRLQLSRALIDFQMDFNEAQQDWENAKHELEVKLIEAEAHGMEADMSAEELATLQQDKEELTAKSAELEKQLAERTADLEKQLEAAKQEAEELRAEVARLTDGLKSLAAGDTGPVDELGAATDAVGKAKEAVEKRKKVAEELKEKERRIAELTVELSDLHREYDQLKNGALLNQTAADEVREAYRRKLENLMRDVGDMGRAVAIMEGDPATPLRVTPEELFKAFQNLTDENTKVTETRESDMRHEMDEVMARHVELKRKFKALYLAYRNLRYLMEDRWPAGDTPPTVVTEEEVVGAAMEGLIRSEEEADRRTINKLRDKASQLESQLAGLHVARAMEDVGLEGKAGAASGVARKAGMDLHRKEISPLLEVENKRLREELDSMRKKMQTVEDPAVAAAKAASGKVPTAASTAASETVIRQLREHGQKVTSELQRKVQSNESRATMAEEQLTQLQAYMAKASVSYQKEIVRLRAIVGQMEVSMGVKQGSYLNMNPLEGAGGGGALRPAAEVLDEMTNRGSALTRAGGPGAVPGIPRGGGGPRPPPSNGGANPGAAGGR